MQLSPAVFNSGAGSHLVDLVQHFIAQTQTLAAEQTFLQYRQQGQSDAQSAALMAVQASTEANVQQLTNQQRLIAERLGEALTAMQNELQEQFQRLQLLESERSSQIETFVNEKLALALQEVQQESHASQMAIATQTDGTRARFDEIETKITSSLEAITTHIHQMVDAKFVAMQDEVGPDGNTAQLVQRLVEAASASATDDIKKTLEADLVRLRDEMQREISSGVEVPVREYVRQLVLELMDHSESKLESRIQRALMNTQAELNLQVQRQADAMSILREQLQRYRAQASNSIDKAVIKAAIKDVLRSEDYVKAEHECENDCIRNAHGDVDHSNFAAQINSTIERSLQAAATTIASAIKAGIRNTDSRSERSSFHDLEYDDNEEEEKMSAEDTQLEQRIQDAWRRTYFNNTDESTDTPSLDLLFMKPLHTATTSAMQRTKLTLGHQIRGQEIHRQFYPHVFSLWKYDSPDVTDPQRVRLIFNA
ncbi:hypothetical protein PHMEG_00028187 [Phytophthora megakarya]|uniref:Uncharacterized protein n=1 Tax=Phytophthora megakarya TaxID=4795 RepID=A0A225V3S7_9STRA|nr:hypothetical protein PHMEG_00028187 [Phytophthora megakarya]